MARYFNGAYSVRAGYHGVRKNKNIFAVSADWWQCENGHTNPTRELIRNCDFPHYEPVKVCQVCGAKKQ